MCVLLSLEKNQLRLDGFTNHSVEQLILQITQLNNLSVLEQVLYSVEISPINSTCTMASTRCMSYSRVSTDHGFLQQGNEH